MPVSFDNLSVGSLYDRPLLATQWGYKGYEAICKGVVTPVATSYIILFVTHDKQKTFTPYDDVLDGNELRIDGEKNHRSDNRIANADSIGDEIHAFYRARHHRPFTYYGRAYLVGHQILDVSPSRFQLIVGREAAVAISSSATEAATHGYDQQFEAGEEGRRRLHMYYSYERSPKNRARSLAVHGTLCVVCGFDFNKTYGPEFAMSYIEVHHTTSITALAGEVINADTDLVPLCSNCHSMAHRKRGVIVPIDELREIVKRNRSCSIME